ncbi:MAG TPA: hypothetical protein VHR41_07260 [Gemmatimonadales bacterium]|nr:hypothetical protein [Gemmatimonadales bacterium]
MAVTQLGSRTPPAPSRGQLVDRLKPLHRRWLEDLRAVLDKAGARDSDLWPRWNAIRYVDTVFWGQFDVERGATDQLSHTMGDKRITRLWAAGELVAMVRWQLCHSVGLCHHAGEFSALTARLLRAVEHWFTEVEEIVGSMSWTDLSMQVREDFASIEKEKGPCWSDLPTSLVTSL